MLLSASDCVRSYLFLVVWLFCWALIVCIVVVVVCFGRVCLIPIVGAVFECFVLIIGVVCLMLLVCSNVLFLFAFVCVRSC